MSRLMWSPDLDVVSWLSMAEQTGSLLSSHSSFIDRWCNNVVLQLRGVLFSDWFNKLARGRHKVVVKLYIQG